MRSKTSILFILRDVLAEVNDWLGASRRRRAMEFTMRDDGWAIPTSDWQSLTPEKDLT
jgi:hypothetical protein